MTIKDFQEYIMPMDKDKRKDNGQRDVCKFLVEGENKIFYFVNFNFLVDLCHLWPYGPSFYK